MSVFRRNPRLFLGSIPLALGLALLLAGSLLAQTEDSTTVAARTPAPMVLWASVDDVIGPISAGYMVDAIEAAERENAAALVIALDTPGGLDTAMRQIIKAILASRVPVCVYVSPRGPGPPPPGSISPTAPTSRPWLPEPTSAPPPR